MKKIVTFCISFALLTSLFAQDSGTDFYPSTYTFEKADEWVGQKEYTKAMWFYLNLYSQYKARVVTEIKKFGAKHDSIELIPLIKESFAMYSPNDPSVNTIENGHAVARPEILKEKSLWVDAIIMRLGDNDKPLTTAFAYYGRGVKKIRVNEFEWAMQDFNKAIELEPSAGEYYFYRGEARKNLNEFMEAVSDYSKAAEFDFKPSVAIMRRAEVNFLAGNYMEAIKDYSQAIKADPGMAEAYAGRGRVKQQQKNYKEALADMDIAVKLRPASAEMLMIRALARREAGEKKDSCADWKAALALGEKKASEFLKKYCN